MVVGWNSKDLSICTLCDHSWSKRSLVILQNTCFVDDHCLVQWSLNYLFFLPYIQPISILHNSNIIMHPSLSEELMECMMLY